MSCEHNKPERIALSAELCASADLGPTEYANLTDTYVKVITDFANDNFSPISKTCVLAAKRFDATAVARKPACPEDDAAHDMAILFKRLWREPVGNSTNRTAKYPCSVRSSDTQALRKVQESMEPNSIA